MVNFKRTISLQYGSADLNIPAREKPAACRSLRSSLRGKIEASLTDRNGGRRKKAKVACVIQSAEAAPLFVPFKKGNLKRRRKEGNEKKSQLRNCTVTQSRSGGQLHVSAIHLFILHSPHLAPQSYKALWRIGLSLILSGNDGQCNG